MSKHDPKGWEDSDTDEGSQTEHEDGTGRKPAREKDQHGTANSEEEITETETVSHGEDEEEEDEEGDESVEQMDEDDEATLALIGGGSGGRTGRSILCGTTRDPSKPYCVASTALLLLLLALGVTCLVTLADYSHTSISSCANLRSSVGWMREIARLNHATANLTLDVLSSTFVVRNRQKTQAPSEIVPDDVLPVFRLDVDAVLGIYEKLGAAHEEPDLEFSHAHVGAQRYAATALKKPTSTSTSSSSTTSSAFAIAEGCAAKHLFLAEVRTVIGAASDFDVQLRVAYVMKQLVELAGHTPAEIAASASDSGWTASALLSNITVVYAYTFHLCVAELVGSRDASSSSIPNAADSMTKSEAHIAFSMLVAQYPAVARVAQETLDAMDSNGLSSANSAAATTTGFHTRFSNSTSTSLYNLASALCTAVRHSSVAQELHFEPAPPAATGENTETGGDEELQPRIRGDVTSMLEKVGITAAGGGATGHMISTSPWQHYVHVARRRLERSMAANLVEAQNHASQTASLETRLNVVIGVTTAPLLLLLFAHLYASASLIPSSHISYHRYALLSIVCVLFAAAVMISMGLVTVHGVRHIDAAHTHMYTNVIPDLLQLMAKSNGVWTFMTTSTLLYNYSATSPSASSDHVPEFLTSIASTTRDSAALQNLTDWVTAFFTSSSAASVTSGEGAGAFLEHSVLPTVRVMSTAAASAATATTPITLGQLLDEYPSTIYELRLYSHAASTLRTIAANASVAATSSVPLFTGFYNGATAPTSATATAAALEELQRCYANVVGLSSVFATSVLDVQESALNNLLSLIAESSNAAAAATPAPADATAAIAQVLFDEFGEPILVADAAQESAAAAKAAKPVADEEVELDILRTGGASIHHEAERCKELAASITSTTTIPVTPLGKLAERWNTDGTGEHNFLVTLAQDRGVTQTMGCRHSQRLLRNFLGEMETAAESVSAQIATMEKSDAESKVRLRRLLVWVLVCSAVMLQALAWFLFKYAVSQTGGFGSVK